MKKTFFTLVAFAISATIASAASIKWAIGGEIDASADIDTSVGSFVLAYIGTTSGVGVDAAAFNDGVGSSYSVVDTGDWNDFYNSRRSTYATLKSYTAADTDGATYQVFYFNNGVCSLVNDPVISTLAITIDNATGIASTAAYVDGSASGGSSLYAAGGSATKIASVPEPSVALMGLLGLGMLLKRRRA